MVKDRFMIAPLQEGEVTSLRPWLIPDRAFERLRNVYIFRGRLRKRVGARLMNTSVDAAVAQQFSRLRVTVGTTAAVTGDFGPVVVPGALFGAGQLFSIGTTFFTVISNVAGAQPMLSTGVATGTFDVATGTVVIIGNGENPNTAVFYYPAFPVMGFANYEITAINNEPTFAFDRQFAYEFTGGAWERLGLAVWTGSDSQFFWSTTYRSTFASERILFVTNYNQPDQIKYWDGLVWTTINPSLGAGNTLETARILLPFKERLVALNTIEMSGGMLRTFVNRARWCQIGSPLQVDAWHDADVTPGKGDFSDAATQEAIISAQFIKDRLIVFFERSTWELAYTGNDVRPFVWQKINTELGVESTFSTIPFDKAILGIANVGVHACNGSNVERIDSAIPDEVFQIQNQNDGVVRVHGIRDYYNELAYWTFPSQENTLDGNLNPTYPTRLLVYNYATGSWAFNDDSITAFGYHQNQEGSTWQAEASEWQFNNNVWNDARFQAEFRNIIAGNQQGWTFLFDAGQTRNSPALQISNLTFVGFIVTMTIYNHNLTINDYILLEQITAPTNLDNQIFKVSAVLDVNTVQVITDALPVGVYTGGGVVTRVSRIDILTKQYNFYQQQGKNAYVPKVDFMVDTTANGQIMVEFYVSTGTPALAEQGKITGTLVGTSVLETTPYAAVPFEQTQTRVWHPLYFQAEGEVVQLRIFLADDPLALADETQLRNVNRALSEFILHGMIIYAVPVSRLQ